MGARKVAKSGKMLCPRLARSEHGAGEVVYLVFGSGRGKEKGGESSDENQL